MGAPVWPPPPDPESPPTLPVYPLLLGPSLLVFGGLPFILLQQRKREVLTYVPGTTRSPA